MNRWFTDAQLHLTTAARSVGVGLATAAWMSVVSAHLQLPSDARTYAGIGGSLVATAVAQLLSGRPPGAPDSRPASSARARLRIPRSKR